MKLLTTLVFSAVSLSPLSGQVAVSLETLGDLELSGSTLIAAGTDVTALAMAPGGYQAGSATTSGSSTIVHGTGVGFELTQSPSMVRLVALGSASAIATLSAPFASASMSVSLRLTLTSPNPIVVDVATTIPIDLTPSSTCDNEEFFADVAQGGQFVRQLESYVDCFSLSACTFVDTLTIGPTPTTLDVNMSAWGYASFTSACGPGNGGGGLVQFEVTPKASGTSYGAPCGPLQLLDEPSLVGPEVIRIVGDPTDTLGLFLIGTSQTEIPLPPLGCSILVGTPVADIVVPLTSGMYQFPLVPVPPPGLLTLQAVSTDGVNLRFSNGLQF